LGSPESFPLNHVQVVQIAKYHFGSVIVGMNCTVFCSILMNNKWKAFAALAGSEDKHPMGGGLTTVGLPLIPPPHR